MKLIRNEALKKDYKRRLKMLPLNILLVAAAFYFYKEEIHTLLILDAITILVLYIYEQFKYY